MDWEKLAKDMIDAAAGDFGKGWKTVRTYAEPELKKLALSVASIGDSVQSGKMDKDEAKLLLDMQKNASRSVLTATKVVSITTAEKALNDALAVLSGPLKKLLGLS